MDQATPNTQAKGNFKMNMNYARSANDRAPAITGTISTPENPENLFNFSAFAEQEADKKTGEIKTYFIGPVSNASSMRQALAQKKEDGTHFITIRPNEFKVFATLEDGTPNPAYEALSDTQKEAEDAKPSWWGKWTRSKELPVLDASAWDRESRYGPWASGNTQHHISKEQLEGAEPAYTQAPDKSPRRTRTRSTDNDMSR